MPTAFTPLSALIGGALIGLAATWLLATIGRIAGVSGIVNRAIDAREERGWRLAFLLAMIAAAGAWFALSGAPARTGFPWIALVAAGLLVGAGTRWGNGCTSGHGICGLARFSRRSLWAVLVFMGAGFATVYAVRHVFGGAA
ncbi:MAG TPA: YeeE/YedE family protein [Lysobacter sp.]